MKRLVLLSAMGLACAGVLGSAQAQEMGHVITSTPVVQDGHTIGYDVQYEYAGKQYSARMPYDPGQTIQLHVTPMPAAQAPVMNGSAPPPGAEQPQAAIIREVPGAAPTAAYPGYPSYPSYPAYPAYPAYGYSYPYPAAYPVYPAYPGYYYPRYYWPPVSLSLGFGYVGHGHH